MPGMNIVSALLKAENYREVKEFIALRDKRCGPDDPRRRVTQGTLVNLRLKYPDLTLEHLEMIATIFGDSVGSVIMWMKSRRPELGNRSPESLLETYEGIHKVEREIDRLFRAL